MKVYICQITPKVGSFKENTALMQSDYNKAQRKGAAICVFPELFLTGYLAEDLFLNPSFIEETQKYINQLVEESESTCLFLPTPIVKDGVLYNGVIAAQHGQVIGQTYKKMLPNYSIFDENRYFTSGEPAIIKVNGLTFGIPICEDIWSDYVCNKLKDMGAEFLISINASPFERNKMTRRINQVTQIFQNTNIPIIYCNQVSAQDGIIFDGNSFCFDGKLSMIGSGFKEASQIVILGNNRLQVQEPYGLENNINENIYQAMVMGVKYYVQNNNFSKVILGLSGGIDSAMVAAIAVDALGASNVQAIMLPSKFTSEESINDAKEVADILGISLKIISINDAVECLNRTINNDDDLEEYSIMYQNLQSRIRGVILMSESNKTGALLLTTGNKSEYATGYATIYGDMNGAFNPIKDIYKTELYELARYKNIIPERILKKAPSAELAPNQKDSDSLPEYAILDKILEQHIEYNKGQKELSKEFDPELVKKILALVKNSEFKRRQAAPGVKISIKTFEKDRRYPITNHYN